MKGYLLISRELDVPRYLLNQRPYPILEFGKTGLDQSHKPVYGYRVISCFQKPDLSNEIMQRSFEKILQKARIAFRAELITYYKDSSLFALDLLKLMPFIDSEEIEHLAKY
jgi:hypothetical protein